PRVSRPRVAAVASPEFGGSGGVVEWWSDGVRGHADRRSFTPSLHHSTTPSLVTRLHLVQPPVQFADDAAVDLELVGGRQLVLVADGPDEDALQHVRQPGDGQGPVQRLVVLRPGGRLLEGRVPRDGGPEVGAAGPVLVPPQ